MWFVFTILTTLLWGCAELFYKRGAHPNEKYAHLKISICVGVVMGLHALYTLIFQLHAFSPLMTLLQDKLGWFTGVEFEESLFDFRNLIRYLPVSLCYILSMTFSYFGMRFIEESISDPIENTSGAIAALLCVIFLHEEISPMAFVAIGIIVVGILGIGFLENSGDTARRKKIGKVMAIVAFAMPFLYAFLDAAGTFLDIFYLEDVATTPLLAVTEETIEEVANTSYEITFAIFALLLFIFLKIRRVKFDIPQSGDKWLAAVLETAGQFTYVYAMSGNGAIAAPIISSVCVVSLLLSRIFLKEKLKWKQYIFIGLVIIGILMLAIIEGD